LLSTKRTAVGDADGMKNRIKAHRKVRAGDLVPHELNPRTHSEAQRAALRLLYDEIGFARSLLAYELPDGRLKLIDGHLRATTTPDELVDVEVLDVNDAEARALLLAIDPLAQLAGYDADILDELRHIAEQDSAAVKSLWDALAESEAVTRKKLRAAADAPDDPLPGQFLILIECPDEGQQVALLQRFRAEGIKCQAKNV
jgi:hypothetical protein